MGHSDVKSPSRQVHTELTLSRSVLTFFAWWFVRVAARSAFLAIGLAFTLHRSAQLKTVLPLLISLRLRKFRRLISTAVMSSLGWLEDKKLISVVSGRPANLASLCEAVFVHSTVDCGRYCRSVDRLRTLAASDATEKGFSLFSISVKGKPKVLHQDVISSLGC